MKIFLCDDCGKTMEGKNGYYRMQEHYIAFGHKPKVPSPLNKTKR